MSGLVNALLSDVLPALATTNTFRVSSLLQRFSFELPRPGRNDLTGKAEKRDERETLEISETSLYVASATSS